MAGCRTDADRTVGLVASRGSCQALVGVVSRHARRLLFFAASLPGRPAGARSAPPGTAPADLQAGRVADVGAAPVLLRPCAAARDFPLTVLQLRRFRGRGASNGNF